jgi:hypothetical protein
MDQKKQQLFNIVNGDKIGQDKVEGSKFVVTGNVYVYLFVNTSKNSSRIETILPSSNIQSYFDALSKLIITSKVKKVRLAD